MSEGSQEFRRANINLVVVGVLGILVLFCLVQIVGNPIPEFGGTFPSVLYSVFVYVPVIAVCILAIVADRRNRRGPPAATSSLS